MPFLSEITGFINDTLKAGSLNKSILQPSKFLGLSNPIYKNPDGKQVERFPAIVEGNGKVIPIAPDSKLAIQVYHKVMGKTYGYEKKQSYGDDYFIKSSADMQMMVICNSKVTGKTKEILEPVLIFGLPQKLSSIIINDLKINSCIISPVSSNMDSMSIFKQEYQGNKYFLSEQMSMFSIRYKVDLVFSQSCIDACLC